MNKKYTVEVIHDSETDEFILPLPEDVLNEVKWQIGDTLRWEDNLDGSFTLSRVATEEKLYLVETVSMFRHRYAVRARSLEHAKDTVVCEEANELSQEHIGENIVSGREITEEEYLGIFDQDNDYLRSWDRDKKMESITQVHYSQERVR
jgi:hypothetical protein